MAKNPKISQSPLSRKHLDRMHREQRQTRLITISAITVITLVIGLILYGYLDQKYFRFMRTVAVVNGEKISVNEFRDFTKYYRNNLIQNADYTFQLASMFGSDQNTMQNFGNQLIQIADELDPERAGNRALDQLINDKLVRQEAAKRGIQVSEAEVEKSMQEALRYYADGTPTPEATLPAISTATLSPEQLSMIPPTATVLPTETLPVEIPATEAPAETQAAAQPETAASPTSVPATSTPAPTPTEYTLEGYQDAYATMIVNLETVEVKESTLRYVIESRLIQQSVKEAVIGEVPCVEEQVRAQHILVDSEELAKEIKAKAEAGEDWFALAAQYSIDDSNKNQGGDLGWFSKGKMVAEFETAVFGMTEPGQISDPVKTEFGFHIIRLVAHEEVPISATACENLSEQKFQDWVEQYRESSQVEIKDFWSEVVPLLPVLPEDIQQAVDNVRNAFGQPQGLPPTTP